MDRFCWNPQTQVSKCPLWLLGIIVKNPERFDQETGNLLLATDTGDVLVHTGEYITRNEDGSLSASFSPEGEPVWAQGA